MNPETRARAQSVIDNPQHWTRSSAGDIWTNRNGEQVTDQAVYDVRRGRA